MSFFYNPLKDQINKNIHRLEKERLDIISGLMEINNELTKIKMLNKKANRSIRFTLINKKTRLESKLISIKKEIYENKSARK